jgi:hypothetical protein
VGAGGAEWFFKHHHLDLLYLFTGAMVSAGVSGGLAAWNRTALAKATMRYPRQKSK